MKDPSCVVRISKTVTRIKSIAIFESVVILFEIIRENISRIVRFSDFHIKSLVKSIMKLQ